MKKGLLAIVAMFSLTVSAFAYDYDKNVPVKGKSIADTNLQTDMLFPVYAYALRAASGDCQKFAITNSEVSVAQKEGAWEEIWTIEACERTVRIPIKFTTKEDKVNFAIDPMGVKVAK